MLACSSSNQTFYYLSKPMFYSMYVRPMGTSSCPMSFQNKVPLQSSQIRTNSDTRKNNIALFNTPRKKIEVIYQDTLGIFLLKGNLF